MSRMSILAVILSLTTAAAQPMGKPWVRHVIDDTSRGADGIRLADVNADGLPDFATGWEEGGMIRLYLHPPADKTKTQWPAVTVGRVNSPEDAVLADLDGDGATDVISSCEGSTRTIYIHWSPTDPAKRMDSAAWQTQALLASEGKMQWMWCVPMQVDGRHGLDLVAGAKGTGAQVGWFEAPADPRQLDGWRWHPLREAGWIMSIVPADMDGDGDMDLAVSDRKGRTRGIYWLEHPGQDAATEPWTIHLIGGEGREVMFMALADTDDDGDTDIITAIKPDLVLHLKRTEAGWSEEWIQLPPTVGRAKAVAFGDIDLDGQGDIVYTTEGATDGRSGVVYLARREDKWIPHEISGPDGVKHDMAVLLDLDKDGDLDVMTCEENKNLGIIWYENPASGAVGE